MIHCLHGNVGSPDSWDLFRGELGDDIHAVDLWSMLEAGPLSLIDAGEAIAESANQGDVLLGYSMGGRLALHALLADREKWKAAIIVSAHPGLHADHKARLHNDDEWARLAEADWDEFLRRWNAMEVLQGNRLPTRGFYQASIANQLNVAQGFRDWSLGTQYNLLPTFPGFGCPVLWITGTLDHKYCSVAEQAVKKLRRGRHIYVPNAGHRVPWEQPEIFNEVVRDFLFSVDQLH